MSNLALARIYRPLSFAKVIGQEHIILALKNSILKNNTHHAYLFSGTRGVGKTTIARIFAKTILCHSQVQSNPCNKCSSCLNFKKQANLDFIEIDAASRTKVEDTREILENTQYKPVDGKYKIYLIDEVHMLSKSSFNALLKTLEEPPKHVKFLFATTEVNKLPLTVLSRCIHFRLTSIKKEQLLGYLKNLIDFKKIPYEQEALEIIATKANGSIRDSLSLLDGILSFNSDKISKDSVAKIVNITNEDKLIGIIKGLKERKTDLKELFFDLNLSCVLLDLCNMLHKIALSQYLDKSDENLAKYYELKNIFTKKEIQGLFFIFKKAQSLLNQDLSSVQMTYLAALEFLEKSQNTNLKINTPSISFNNQSQVDSKSNQYNNKQAVLKTDINPKQNSYEIQNNQKQTLIKNQENIEKNSCIDLKQTQEDIKIDKKLDIIYYDCYLKLKLDKISKEILFHANLLNLTDEFAVLNIKKNLLYLFDQEKQNNIKNLFEDYFQKPNLLIKIVSVDAKDNKSPYEFAKEESLEKLKQAQKILAQDEEIQHILNTYDAILETKNITIT